MRKRLYNSLRYRYNGRKNGVKKNISNKERRFKELVEPFLEKVKQKIGRPTKVRHYQFFCGMLYILRTGISWRDLPEEYSN